MNGPVVGLAEIVLWAHDMERSLHFYESLFGLELISPPELPAKFLKAADGPGGIPAMIVLSPYPDPEHSFPKAKRERTLHHLAFNVAEVAYDSLRARFQAEGIEVRTGVHPVLKGVNTFYVDDPDGNEVEVISQAHHSELPASH